MKATGIVRRIDELGRLVIPKEIRRSLRIRESDPIEIYTDRDGEIILRKYARMRELGEYAAALTQALAGMFGATAAVTDTETVLAAAGALKKQLTNATLSDPVATSIRRRQPFCYDESAVVRPALLAEQTESMRQVCAVPVSANGDPVGSVLLCTAEPRTRFGDAELTTLKTISLYLGKLLEE